ncbi:hypothetical protein A4H97_28030 [Niastella yeongjuensis]|uniref:Uncharacterized protein n=1 Tax=Niastella yeongjuensis TaxID=354355 RepID=A0A1V9EUA1_9BACT|nr:hypothetical protein [Niastella yeongjuensis]OQP49743.1 hypothetical protein A4H97_28030 [Niastella yeongjuensis]SEP40695.1 hypothetical protein SAMN05660816_05829 [Niastella yeongjuensis]
MDIPQGKSRPFPAVAIVLVLLVLCVIPGQLLVAKQFPNIAGRVQISPSVVFLDIPVRIPLDIDMIIVPALFFLIYPLVIAFSPSRRQVLQRIRAAFSGLFILLVCILAGGLIYYLVQDRLTKQVLTGINSFGLNADIHLPYPGYETIHLRGSLIVFVCCLIGLFIFLRKIRKTPVEGLTREQRMTPYERMLRDRRMPVKQPQQRTIIETSPITIQTNSNRQSGLCYCQPVIRLKPEALYYMPV